MNAVLELKTLNYSIFTPTDWKAKILSVLSRKIVGYIVASLESSLEKILVVLIEINDEVDNYSLSYLNRIKKPLLSLSKKLMKLEEFAANQKRDNYSFYNNFNKTSTDLKITIALISTRIETLEGSNLSFISDWNHSEDNHWDSL
jgi:uncharacterized UPF0160 family protein